MRIFSTIKRNRVFVLTSLIATVGLYLALAQQDVVAREPKRDKIIMVGLDAMNHSVSEAIPVDDYARELAKAFGTVNESMVPALKNRAPVQATREGGYHLNSIGVGIGLKGTIGLGPIVNITPSAQVRLVFTDSSNPIYPN